MSSSKKITVIGGGLAGLTAAILLVGKQHAVTVVERKTYPFHRVCGEYISNEVVPFLKREKIYPNSVALPAISNFHLTSVNGKKAEMKLDLGGFGVSRFFFDHFLYEVARQAGVEFLLDTEVDSVLFQQDHFTIGTEKKEWPTDVAIGSFGKRSKLDYGLGRSFIQKRSPYVGVKYHIETDHPADTIALHNFQDGYCGISRVEQGIANLCYLTHRKNLKEHKTIEQMQEAVLFKNPFLKSIFSNSRFLFEKPEVINEISFETKNPVEQHVLMAGDAAGMITPLCGNGMAMAIHSAKILSEWVHAFCEGQITRSEMENGYEREWKEQFATRLWAGRQIQRLFGSSTASNFAVQLAKNISPVARFLVSQTHGRPF
jgi:menaquinone-9 beta-reductase